MAAIRSLAALAALSLVQNVHAWYPQLPPCVDPFRPFVYAGCFQDKGTPEALIVRADLDTQDMTIEKCTRRHRWT